MKHRDPTRARKTDKLVRDLFGKKEQVYITKTRSCNIQHYYITYRIDRFSLA